MTTPDEWRWTDERGVQRLVRTDELRAALASRLIPPSTLVWRQGMGEWMPAAMMPELSAAIMVSGGSGVPAVSSSLDEASSVTSVMAASQLGSPVSPTDQVPNVVPDALRKVRTLVGMTVPAALVAESQGLQGPTAPIVVPAANSAKDAVRRGVGVPSPTGYRSPDLIPGGIAEIKGGERAPITFRGPIGAGGAASMPAAPAASAASAAPATSAASATSGLPSVANLPPPPPLVSSPPATEAHTKTELLVPTKETSPARAAGGASGATEAHTKTELLVPTPAKDPSRPSFIPPAPPGRGGQTAVRPTPLAGGASSSSSLSGSSAASRSPGPANVSKAVKPGASATPIGETTSLRSAPPPVAETTSLRSAPAGSKFVPPTPANVRPSGSSPPPAAGSKSQTSAAAGGSFAKPPETAASPVIPPAPALPNVGVARAAVANAPSASVVVPSASVAPSASEAPSPERAPATTAKSAEVASDAVAAQARVTPTTPFPSFSGQSSGEVDVGFDEPAAEQKTAATSTAASADQSLHTAPEPAPIAAALEAHDAATARLNEIGSAISPADPAYPATDATAPPGGSAALPYPPRTAGRAPVPDFRGEPAPSALPSFSGPALGPARSDPDLNPADFSAGRGSLRQQVPVPISSLLAVGASLVVMVVASFVVGRCSVADRPAENGHEAARSSIYLLPYISQRAIPEPLKPCWVARQPVMWAPRVSKSIPFDVVSTTPELVSVGYARSEKEAVGIDVEVASGKIIPRFSKDMEDAIDRVTPASAGTFVVTTETQGGSIRPLVQVPDATPFTVGVGGSSVSLATDPSASPSTLWPLQGEGDAGAVRVQPVGGAGHAIIFRRGSAIWGGFIGPDHKPVGALSQVPGSGGVVGKPLTGWNGRELAVVFADRPKDSDHYEIRVGRAPSGSIPSATVVIPLPKGGPGGDAFAPGIAGLDDGRWVLVWTEGSQGNRAIRAQTLAPDLSPIGDPIALSPPAGNFGQGLPGVAGRSIGVVFLSQGKVSYELWGAMLQCG